MQNIHYYSINAIFRTDDIIFAGVPAYLAPRIAPPPGQYTLAYILPPP